MDYKDFTKRDVAFAKFVKYRREVLDGVDNGKFVELFTELCTKAMSGDCVAQDCVAYFFNMGVPDFLYPNYDYYMSWEILAGANGNEFALEKLQFFLNLALDAIIDNEELLMQAMLRKNITKENAVMMISNALCEGVVDELGLDAPALVDISRTAIPYSPQRGRKFTNALQACFERVVEYLAS